SNSDRCFVYNSKSSCFNNNADMGTRLLPSKSLKLNTDKSHFAYFHDELTPLSERVRTSLAHHNIEYHHDWVGVVGAVVGRDDDSIPRGIRHIMVNNTGHHVFFDRLQQPELSIPTAMLLLRMCM